MPPHLQRLVDHLVAIRQAVDLAVVQVLEHVMALLRARSRSAERTLGWRRRPTDGATHLERVRVGLSVRATALEVLATHEARVHVKIVASDGAGLLEICHEREGSWRGERRREACGGASNTPKSRSVRLIVSRKGQRNPSSSQGRLRRPRPLLEGTLGAAASQGWQLPPSGASAAPPLSGRGRFDAICCRARVAAAARVTSGWGTLSFAGSAPSPRRDQPDSKWRRSGRGACPSQTDRSAPARGPVAAPGRAVRAASAASWPPGTPSPTLPTSEGISPPRGNWAVDASCLLTTLSAAV